MSNFKERQASAKKVIQLQNEILTLKQQLSTSKSPQKCDDCSSLREELQVVSSVNEELSQELSSLKAEMKKIKSDNTRMKKKLKDPLEEQESDV